MCGTEIPDGIRTCPECGAKIIADGTQEKERPWQDFAETRRMHDRNCPYCNREMDRGYINCRGERGAAKVCWCTGDPGFLSDIMGELGGYYGSKSSKCSWQCHRNPCILL